MLSRNLPPELETILANCLAHARRNFVDVVDRFPEECEFVIHSLAVVYHQDKLARESSLTPAERLAWHQTHSQAIDTMLNRWNALDIVPAAGRLAAGQQSLRTGPEEVDAKRVLKLRQARHKRKEKNIELRQKTLPLSAGESIA
jgi:hypothetical protein